MKIVKARMHGSSVEVSLTGYLKVDSLYQVEQIGNKIVLNEVEVIKKE